MAGQNIPHYKNARNDLSAEYLKSVLNYAPETGVFTWCVKHPSTRRYREAGYAVANEKERRRRICVGGFGYLAHRLAWLWMTGKWPDYEIDHRDGDGLNNKWCNIREATPDQNGWNKTKNKRNKSGYKGVSWDKVRKKWAAQIRYEKTNHRLGFFDTVEEAHETYIAAAKKFHGEFARVK